MDAEDSIAADRQRKVRQRVFKEKPYKVMHVCMATDVQVAKLRDERPWSPKHYFKEHVLLSVRVYSDGLLEMSPEFSRVLEEDESRAHLHSSGTAPSVFMSNKTVAAGIKKGLRLHTYRLRSDDGSEFEYSIENVNEYALPSQVEAARAASILSDAFASQASRSELGPWKMDPPAQGFTQSASYMCEIVSGTGFEGEQLFVAYHVTYPPAWRLRTGDVVDGTSEDALQRLARGEGGNKRTSLLAATALEMDGFDDGLAARGGLQGTTHTVNARATRGGLSIPILRPFWKGKHLPYSFDGLSRFVWGCSFFLLTVISFVVGVEYPFWLIPCLIFTFGLGTGYPGGPAQVCLRVPMGAQNRSESRQAGKRLVGPQVSLPVACFNHLVSLSFDRNASSSLGDGGAVPSAEMPTIVFQVYSCGAFGRVSLEGYGYQHLPVSAGSIDVVVRTWRPLGGIASQMADFFLGSSVRLQDPNFVDMPGHLKFGGDSQARPASVLNRFGVSSETSGELRFRCHVVTATPGDSAASILAASDSTASLSRTRSVEDILKSTLGGGAGSSRLGASLSASGSLAALGGSGRFSALGGSGPLSLSLSAPMQPTPSAREADSASLSRRAEMLLAQAKSKVAALGAIGIGALSESKDATGRRSPGLLPLGSADSKDFGPGRVAAGSKGSKPGRYSDSEEETAGLLGKR